MADEKVEVTLGANVSQLESGVEQAASAVDAGTARMIALLEKLVAASAESTAEIVANEQHLAAEIEVASEESAGSISRMTERIRESTAEAKESLESFAGGINHVQQAFKLLAEVAMLGFVGEKVIDLGKEFAEFGEQTEIAAHKSGLSGAAIQELGFAAKMTGMNAEQMNQAMMRLSRAMANAQQGSVQAEEAFKSVGLSAEALKEMPIDEVLMKVADAFASSEDGATKAAIAMQLFGRAGAEMIPLLDKGSAGIEELRAKAQELGIVMDSETVAAGAKLNEQLKEMDAQMQAVKLRAGSELAPAMLAVTEALAEAGKKGGILDEMFGALAVAMKAVVTVGLSVAFVFEQIAEVVVTSASAMGLAASGQFSAAAATINIGLQNMQHNADSLDESLRRMWADAAGGDKLDLGEMGGGKDGWEEKGQLKLGKKAAKGSSGPGQVEIWRQQLQEQEEASNNFFKDNLAGEDAFWTSKLALTKVGSKEYLQVYHELFNVKKQEAQQDLANAVETTHAEYDAAKQGSMDRANLANDIAQRIGEAYGFESKQYNAALIQERKAAQEYAQFQAKMIDDAIIQQQKAALGEIAIKEQAEKNKFKRSQESEQQEIANLMGFENQRYAVLMAGFDEELTLYANDEANYRKTLDAKLAATQKHALDVAKLEEQSADAVQKSWEQALSPISGAFTASIGGIIAGTTTLQQAMGRMIDSILLKFIDMGVQMVVHWAATEAAKLAASANANTVLQALGLQSAVQSKVVGTTEAMSQIGSDAAAAGAGAYAATALIPYVGPALAPAAAAEAYASTIAFEGLASAAGGYYDVPHDMLANIHKDEMVLPSWGAKGIRDMISGGGAQASGSNTINVNTTMNGNSDAAFKGLIMQHAEVVAAAVKQQMRNFQR